MHQRTYTDDQLAAAMAASHSWRGVLRALGLKATSAGSARSVRRHADRLGLSNAHFTGQRRWSDSELVAAIEASRSWAEVTRRIGLADGRSATVIRGHAARLGVDVAHLEPAPATPDRTFDIEPRLELLRCAAPTLAAAWFQLRGHAVSWPLEPVRYDLLVESAGRILRVQVKTTVAQASTRGAVSLSNARRIGRDVYAHDEVDFFFVIDDNLDAFLIPVAKVAGRYSITLAAYLSYRVARGGRWLEVANACAPAP